MSITIEAMFLLTIFGLFGMLIHQLYKKDKKQ